MPRRKKVKLIRLGDLDVGATFTLDNQDYVLEFVNECRARIRLQTENGPRYFNVSPGTQVSGKP